MYVAPGCDCSDTGGLGMGPLYFKGPLDATALILGASG